MCMYVCKGLGFVAFCQPYRSVQPYRSTEHGKLLVWRASFVGLLLETINKIYHDSKRTRWACTWLVKII